MAQRARHGGFLFKRDGSDNYYIKLRSGTTRLERSLGTPDRLRAEIVAAPLIAAHRASLLALRPKLEQVWAPRLAPGLHDGPDGGRIAATDRELTHYDAGGAFLRTEPNGAAAFQIVGHGLSAREEFATLDRAYAGAAPVGAVRPSCPTKTSDDSILELYIADAGLVGYFERECRAVWALFRSLCDKPLRECSRDDARKLVVHYEAKGLKSASVKKKLGWLRAACAFAVKEGKLKSNIFSSIVSDRDDAERRLPLDDNDITVIKSKLATLSDTDALLFRTLACSGMRLSEAFEISGEQIEHGVRFVIVGSKTDASLRRIPLPRDLLPFLPKIIKGPLFTGATNTASKRLNGFLRDVGIVDPGKVVHSLRHRAKDKLRAAGCPLDLQYELLGHEISTVASGYGRGSPVPLLRKWIDKIGF